MDLILTKKRILLLVSGGIAIYKSLDLISNRKKISANSLKSFCFVWLLQKSKVPLTSSLRDLPLASRGNLFIFCLDCFVALALLVRLAMTEKVSESNSYTASFLR